MDTNIVLFIVGGVFCILLAYCIWLTAQIHSIKKMSKIFFQGKDGGSLESTMLEHIDHLKKIDSEILELYDVCTKIHSLASKGLYQVGTIRFNPFKDVGGDQSFAVAFLDGQRNGVVFSSLLTKSGTRIYAKPVIKGKGIDKFPLTEEENHAVASATPLKHLVEDAPSA